MVLPYGLLNAVACSGRLKVTSSSYGSLRRLRWRINEDLYLYGEHSTYGVVSLYAERPFSVATRRLSNIISCRGILRLADEQ